MKLLWNKPQWQNIMQRKDSLPHALLLRGRAGVGKLDFATQLSHALLCQQPRTEQSNAEQACGACASCLWLKEGTHPDFRLISPEDDSNSESSTKKKTGKKTQISVDQIRQLNDYLSLSTHQVKGRRIILIAPAEALNLASANALLKMLEEPPANTLFLLVASQPQRLLPTIMSRCQAVDFPIPAKADAMAWLTEQGMSNPEATLAYAGGAPLVALQMQSQLETNDNLLKQLSMGGKLNPFSSAPLFLSAGMDGAIQLIQKWVFDLMSSKLAESAHYHAPQAATLQALCKSVNLSALVQFQKNLVQAKRAANHPLSHEMQLENLLLQYTKIFQ
jgi:DNA polymerase-3 subunit delta'|tara:strand:- start:6548 stop:7546 length:999 start_codon:yes stop_codon:yes gene_type:complete